MKKNKKLPPAYVAETKDARHAGTFEVLVPVPGRNKPHRAASEFPRSTRPKAGCTAKKARTRSPRSCARPRRSTANSV